MKQSHAGSGFRAASCGRLPALVVGACLVFGSQAARGASAPGPISLSDLAAGGKAQAKARFKALPPETRIRLADGRILTKAELEAEGRRKPKPDFGAKAPGGARASKLADLNAALAAKVRVKLDVNKAKAAAEMAIIQKGLPGKIPCLAPHIESVFPFSDITPGGSALVKGSCFSSSPGQFVLTLSQSGVEIPLGGLQWSETGVAGVIPADHPAFKTAPTQPATLAVKKGGTATSPGVTYRAGREVREIPFDQLSIKVSTESDDDRCYDWGGGPTGICTHYTGPWDPAGGDQGVDKFHVSLQNGWTIHSWDLVRGEGSTGWFMSNHKDAGQSAGSVDVPWLILCGTGCHCWYYMDVYVEGEIGTSWK